MNVSLLATITADGLIGRDANHLADWTPPGDKKHFVSVTKKAGVVVMGSKTFDTIGKPLPGRKMIIYTSNPQKYTNLDAETTDSSPQELITRLEAAGYKDVAICGGARIYDIFLQSGLVTDLYLTIAPLLFGTGVPLFVNPTQTELRLVEHRMLSESAPLLHYKVM